MAAVPWRRFHGRRFDGRRGSAPPGGPGAAGGATPMAPMAWRPRPWERSPPTGGNAPVDPPTRRRCPRRPRYRPPRRPGSQGAGIRDSRGLPGPAELSRVSQAIPGQQGYQGQQGYPGARRDTRVRRGTQGSRGTQGRRVPGRRDTRASRGPGRSRASRGIRGSRGIQGQQQYPEPQGYRTGQGDPVAPAWCQGGPPGGPQGSSWWSGQPGGCRRPRSRLRGCPADQACPAPTSGTRRPRGRPARRRRRWLCRRRGRGRAGDHRRAGPRAGPGSPKTAATGPGQSPSATPSQTHSASPAPMRPRRWAACRSTQLRAGDCLTGANLQLNTASPWPKLAQAVPCSQRHTAEVFLADNGFWPENVAFPGSDHHQGGRRGVQQRIQVLRRESPTRSPSTPGPTSSRTRRPGRTVIGGCTAWPTTPRPATRPGPPSRDRSRARVGSTARPRGRCVGGAAPPFGIKGFIAGRGSSRGPSRAGPMSGGSRMPKTSRRALRAASSPQRPCTPGSGGVADEHR